MEILRCNSVPGVGRRAEATASRKPDWPPKASVLRLGELASTGWVALSPPCGEIWATENKVDLCAIQLFSSGAELRCNLRLGLGQIGVLTWIGEHVCARSTKARK
jgi:hypothetical protein